MSKIFLFAICASVSLLHCQESKSEKIRISPREVYVDEQGVFILVNGQWVAVELYRDSKEISIKPFYQTISYGFIWQCNCGTWNFASDQECRECAKGRYDYSGDN